MKQTAVEILIEQFKLYLPTIHQKGLELQFSEALELEKQQIKAAYDASQTKCVNTANNVLKMLRKKSVFEINATESEQYYFETYKNETE